MCGLVAVLSPRRSLPVGVLVAMNDALRHRGPDDEGYLVDDGAGVRLTPRERDVLALLVEGRSNDEIGLALGIGSKTVETHVARMFDRFGVASRTELATRSVREGWLDVPPG